MRRNVVNAYVFDGEKKILDDLAKRTKWPGTEVVSCLIRMAFKNFNYEDYESFDQKVTELLAEAQFAEYAGSEAGKKYLAERVNA